MKWQEFQAILLGMGVFGMDAGAWTPLCTPLLNVRNFTHCLRNSQVPDLPLVILGLVGWPETVPDGWLPKVEKFVERATQGH